MVCFVGTKISQLFSSGSDLVDFWLIFLSRYLQIGMYKLGGEIMNARKRDWYTKMHFHLDGNQ